MQKIFYNTFLCIFFRYTFFCYIYEVVTYGVLCALATSDRKQLRTKITELGNNWVQGKDSIPAIWAAVDKFINCDYGECLQLLEKMRTACDQINVYFSCSFCTRVARSLGVPTRRVPLRAYLHSFCLIHPHFLIQIDHPGSHMHVFE